MAPAVRQTRLENPSPPRIKLVSTAHLVPAPESDAVFPPDFAPAPITTPPLLMEAPLAPASWLEGVESPMVRVRLLQVVPAPLTEATFLPPPKPTRSLRPSTRAPAAIQSELNSPELPMTKSPAARNDEPAP